MTERSIDMVGLMSRSIYQMLNRGIELMSIGIKGESNESSPGSPKTGEEKAADDARRFALMEEIGFLPDEDIEDRKLLIPVFCTADISIEVFRGSFGLEIPTYAPD